MFPTLTPVTRNLIILNVMLYLVSNFLYPRLYDVFSAFFPLSPNFHAWQIVTHMFMHARMGEGIGITHILFNMMTLWSFGPVLENALGSRKFTLLYFVSGLGAFVVFNLWNYFQIHEITAALVQQGVNPAIIYQKAALSYTGDMGVPATTKAGTVLAQELYSALRTPMLGASGAIFGVLAAFAALFPEAALYIMFIPIPVKAKYLLPAAILISLYLGVTGKAGDVAHFAHIGGALTGFLLALVWKKNQFRTL